MTSPMVALSERQRKIKNLALRGTEPDPMDPKAPEIWAQLKEARDAAAGFHGSPKSEAPAPPSSSQVKRKSGSTPKGKPPVKISKNDSPAPIPKEEKNQVTELRRVLRESETQLQSARGRVKRLENKEDDMKKFHEELTKKSEEKLEGYGDLRDLKCATFNHFLGRWENANEDNQGDDISELRLTIPLAIRSFFLSRRSRSTKIP